MTSLSKEQPKNTQPTKPILYLEDFYETYREAQLEKLKNRPNATETDLTPQKRRSFEDNTQTLSLTSKVPRHSCPKCSYASRRSDNLHHHLLVAHKTRPDLGTVYRCSKCDFTSSQRSTLTSHTYTHTKRTHAVYRCAKCPFQTRNRPTYLKHTKSDTEDDEDYLDDSGSDSPRVFPCAQCSFFAKARKCLRNHLMLHRVQPKVHKCPLCSYKNEKKRKLERHMSVHSESEETYRYRCDECPFRTKWSDALNSHMERHVIYEPGSYEARGCHRCSKCTYNARNRAHLTRHERLH